MTDRREEMVTVPSGSLWTASAGDGPAFVLAHGDRSSTGGPFLTSLDTESPFR